MYLLCNNVSFFFDGTINLVKKSNEKKSLIQYDIKKINFSSLQSKYFCLS